MARYSTMTFSPSRKPFFSNCDENARYNSICVGEMLRSGPRNPTRGSFLSSCARAQNGHVTAPQVKTLINSRRLMLAPEAQALIVAICTGARKGRCRRAMFAWGQKRTCAVHKLMSALGQKRDIGARYSI